MLFISLLPNIYSKIETYNILLFTDDLIYYKQYG